MKKKNGFVLHRVCEQNIIVAEGKENIDFENLISLNATAAFLWDALGDEAFTIEMMAQALCREYGVSLAQAAADSAALAQAWRQAGIIED